MYTDSHINHINYLSFTSYIICTFVNFLHNIFLLFLLPHSLPQHRSRWRRRLVQLLVAFGLPRHLFVDVACRSHNTGPQCRSQCRVMQHNPHLQDMTFVNIRALLKDNKNAIILKILMWTWQQYCSSAYKLRNIYEDYVNIVTQTPVFTHKSRLIPLDKHSRCMFGWCRPQTQHRWGEYVSIGWPACASTSYLHAPTCKHMKYHIKTRFTT